MSGDNHGVVNSGGDAGRGDIGGRTGGSLPVMNIYGVRSMYRFNLFISTTCQTFTTVTNLIVAHPTGDSNSLLVTGREA